MAFSKPAVLTLKQLQALTGDEVAELKKYTTIIKQGTPEQKAQLIEDLTKPAFGIKKIYRFATNTDNPDLAKIFNQFCDDEKNQAFQTFLALRLHKANYSNFVIDGLDKKQHSSLFSRLKGALTLAEFDKYPEPQEAKEALELLDTACDLGMRRALNIRLGKSLAEVSEQKADEQVFARIFHDTTALCNLFRTVGYMDAANILFSIATAYAQLPNAIVPIVLPANKTWQAAYDSQDQQPYVLCLQSAIEYLYIAQKLENDALSKKIITYFFPEKGVFGNYDKVFPKSWDAALDHAGKWDYFRAHHEKMLAEGFSLPAPAAFCRVAAARAEQVVASFKLEAMDTNKLTVKK